jgi:hypothetical protein
MGLPDRKVGNVDLIGSVMDLKLKVRKTLNRPFAFTGSFLQYIFDRLHREYFMRPRIGEFDALLGSLKLHGYEFCSVLGFAEMVRTGVQRPRKCCIIRIDVDSDPKFCLLFSDVLRKHDCSASFYFRLCTIDRRGMRQLLDYGFEVGYHFEELATLAKKYHLKSPNEVLARIDECRSEFRKNFIHFSNVLGARPATVASHGDFANRKLGQTNAIIVDENLRKELGIYAEAYDNDLVSAFDHSVIDRGPPVLWMPDSPEQLAIEASNESHCIRILLHPKQWRNSFYWNTRQIIERVVQGILY